LALFVRSAWRWGDLGILDHLREVGNVQARSGIPAARAGGIPQRLMVADEFLNAELADEHRRHVPKRLGQGAIFRTCWKPLYPVDAVSEPQYSSQATGAITRPLTTSSDSDTRSRCPLPVGPKCEIASNAGAGAAQPGTFRLSGRTVDVGPARFPSAGILSD
jgi:hypothetical protein